MAANGELVTEVPATAEDGQPVRLRIVARGSAYDFYQSTPEEEWVPIATDQDGTILSTRAAGGFVGAVFGVYAISDQGVSHPRE